MNLMHWVVMASGLGVALAGISVQRAGWLDRVVNFYKNTFIADVQRLAPVQIQASIERAPLGYSDSDEWEYASVSRLLALLGASEGAAPVRRTLRRALRHSGPTRRFISKQKSWKLFPSLGKNHPNEIYYDFNYYDYDESTEGPMGLLENEDEMVLVLQNPVEARLPSARISVKLLREILEARAIAARKMPSTTRSTIPWIPMNKTENNATERNGVTTTNAAADGNKQVTDGAGGDDGGDNGNGAPDHGGDEEANPDTGDDGGAAEVPTVDDALAESGENQDNPPKPKRPDPDKGDDLPPGLRKRKETVKKIRSIKKQS